MLLVLVTVVSLFLSNSITTAQNNPELCSQSTSINFNTTQINGTWWEVARNPAPTDNWDCVEVNFIEEPNNVLKIETTYSNTPSYLWVNQTMYANITLNAAPSTNDYNISYVNGLTDTPYTVYKLLATDYQSYAFICGYTNASDDSTSFGIVLTRDRYPNTTILNNYEEMASNQYADFTNGTMSLITQNPTCYASGANSLCEYQIVGTLLAVLLYALLHFIM